MDEGAMENDRGSCDRKASPQRRHFDQNGAKTVCRGDGRRRNQSIWSREFEVLLAAHVEPMWSLCGACVELLWS